MAAKSLPFASLSPQALPKFNPRKQPLMPIPNELFTGHSREKQEPHIHEIVVAERNSQGTHPTVVE